MIMGNIFKERNFIENDAAHQNEKALRNVLNQVVLINYSL